MPPDERVAALLYRHRGWVPILPILAALVWASPCRPWWMIGVGLMLVGEGLRCWAAAHLGVAARSSRPLTHKLVNTGPYAHTRHPLYWGNACLALGFTTATGAGWPWFVLVVGGMFVVLYGMHARREEHALLAAFPAEYAAYRVRVPAVGWRFWPARVGGGEKTRSPSIREALRVEAPSIHAEFWLLMLLWLRERLF